MLLLLAARVRADVRISFPTEGRYRAGRCFPVRIEDAAGNAPFRLSAPGTLPTELSSVRSNDLIVPWFAVSDEAGKAAWSTGDGSSHPIATPLRALAGDERLVAFATTDEGAAQALFPGKSIVPIRLDRSGPILDPVEAWESLDAIVLSDAAIARLRDSDRATLLAAGTLIAVRSLAPPDDRWPWQRTGDLWVLRHTPVGPTSAVDSSVYSPTYDWERGWPLAVRQTIVGFAAIYCILGVGVLLWRSRWTVAAFLALTVLCGAALAAWAARRDPMLQKRVAVRANDARFDQFDVWTWESPVRASRGSAPAVGFVRPVFASAHQVQQVDVMLRCAADGRPDRFTFRLERGHALAFVSRIVRGASATPSLLPVSREWPEFVGAAYPDAGISGQYAARIPAADEPVPVVVIQRK